MCSKINIRKTRVSAMNEKSRACDSSDFIGNTTLVGSDDNEYIFVSGFEVIRFNKEDRNKDFISLIDNNMISTTMAVGEKDKNFSFDHYEFIRYEKIEERTLLNSINDSVDPYDYHVLKCG